MKRQLSLLLSVTFALLSSGITHALDDVTLYGKVPGRYLDGKAKNRSHLSKVVIKKGVIKEVTPIAESQVPKGAGAKTLVLKDSSGKYNVIYPGLLDLHNHTKQNNLPLWGDARGQFANRFEWRGWSQYKSAVSANMNPWIGNYGKAVSCAAFRWSELQAMVLGTTFLQGPSSCVKDFAIHHVEGGDGFLYSKKDAAGNPVVPLLNVSAPTDVIYPNEFTFVWDEVKPKMTGKKSFSDALEQVVYEKCPSLKTKVQTAYQDSTKKLETALAKAKAQYDAKKDSRTVARYENAKYALEREVMMDSGVLKVVTNKKLLEKSCKDYHSKFLRYMSFLHSSVAGKINYIGHPHKAAVIAHLGEGRRNDPYNMLEFELLKTLGLDAKGFNFVHGVGVDKKGYKHMAKKGMGLIWSPFSNLLLYNETADIVEAKRAGVTIALGSDWTPTGSKSVLEELKIAKNYILKNGLKTLFSDEELYKMVTENSAELINHLETDPNDGKHGIGKVVADAVGTLIVVSENTLDPHTNLVEAESKDINLVLIHGKPTYGNVSYLKKYDVDVEYEEMPNYIESLNDLISKDSKGNPTGVASGIPTLADGQDGKDLLLTLMKNTKVKKFEGIDGCGFEEVKGFVFQDSLKENNGKTTAATHAADDLVKLKKEAGIDLDRAFDIQKLMGVLMLTQGRNITGSASTAKKAIGYFPSLFSCNDDHYTERFSNFIGNNKNANDEVSENSDYRIAFRKKDQDARDAYNKKNPTKAPKKGDPQKTAESYGLEYDTEEGVVGY